MISFAPAKLIIYWDWEKNDSPYGCLGQLHHHYLYSYVNLLVKLLKRLLEFKSLLLFLIKCTEKAAMMNWRTGSWGSQPLDRDRLSPPVRADQGTRSGRDRRRRGSWPSVLKNGKTRRFASFSSVLTPLGFFSKTNNNTSLCKPSLAPWPKGPRPLTPPPSASMHPASMLTLDQRSTTWTPEISRSISGNLRTDELAFIPERRHTTDCGGILEHQQKARCVPKNRKSKDFGTEPSRAGEDPAVNRPQLTIFQLYSNQQQNGT